MQDIRYVYMYMHVGWTCTAVDSTELFVVFCGYNRVNEIVSGLY